MIIIRYTISGPPDVERLSLIGVSEEEVNFLTLCLNERLPVELRTRGAPRYIVSMSVNYPVFDASYFGLSTKVVLQPGADVELELVTPGIGEGNE